MADQIVNRGGTTGWQRVASVALTAAGLLILTSLLFPRPVDAADHAGFLSLLADNAGRTKVVTLAVPVGIWALAAGVSAISRCAVDSAGSAWFVLGRYAVLAGSAVVTVQFALGTAALAEATSGSFDTGLVLWVAATFVRLFGMLLVWAGVALVGLGMLTNGGYPRWIPWSPLVLGVGVVLASAIAILEGPSTDMAAASSGLAALTAIWLVLFGLRLRRHVPAG